MPKLKTSTVVLFEREWSTDRTDNISPSYNRPTLKALAPIVILYTYFYLPDFRDSKLNNSCGGENLQLNKLVVAASRAAKRFQGDSSKGTVMGASQRENVVCGPGS